MKKLYIVSFDIKTTKFRNLNVDCEHTVFADSYDEAAEITSNYFAGYQINIDKVRYVGEVEKSSRAPYKHEKEMEGIYTHEAGEENSL